MRSLVDVFVDGFHEIESSLVEDADVGDATLVDGAGGDVGSSSRDADAEGPAGLSNLLSTLISALLELVLTSLGRLALIVLVFASILDALLEGFGLGKDYGQEQGNQKNGPHQ